MRNVLWLGCSLAALAGCGKTDNRVAGTVTIGAAPLESGVVRFAPESGPVVAATVGDGKYGAQLPAGKYTVTVEATSPPGGNSGTSDDRSKTKALAKIPEKYKTGVSIDIAGPNPALDFDLSK